MISSVIAEYYIKFLGLWWLRWSLGTGIIMLEMSVYDMISCDGGTGTGSSYCT